MSARDEISLELMSLHPSKALRTASMVDKYVDQVTKSLQGENERLKAENAALRARLEEAERLLGIAKRYAPDTAFAEEIERFLVEGR